MMQALFDIHADDYAISENSDKSILDLCAQGKLDSISFIPNLSYAATAAEKLLQLKNNGSHFPLVSVHINFVEGHCSAKPEEVADLVDSNGFFTATWEKLFVWNYNPLKRSKIRSQLKKEIIAQTEHLLALNVIDKNGIRFDSHMHTHMIPLVFDALTDAIKEKNWTVDFIRNTLDPIHCYMGQPALYKTYSPINIVKCLILNFFSVTKIKPALKKMGFRAGLLCGVFFSGHMDRERLPKILPVFARKSRNGAFVSEILFHPCLMKEDELSPEFNKEGINEFHLSPNRMIEFEAADSLPFADYTRN